MATAHIRALCKEHGMGWTTRRCRIQNATPVAVRIVLRPRLLRRHLSNIIGDHAAHPLTPHLHYQMVTAPHLSPPPAPLGERCRSLCTPS